jgi:thioredoxin domain-containing protein 5
VEKYQGQRTDEDLKAFVIHKLGSSYSVPAEGTVKTEHSSPVVSYSSNNFEHGISTGISFTKFFAPW